MIMIIICVSSASNNDDAVAGATFFLSRADLTDEKILRVVWRSDERNIIIHDDNDIKEQIHITADDPCLYSPEYLCMSTLAPRVNAGDKIMFTVLSGLGRTWEEAASMYMSLLKRGIHLEFYDAQYLDTEKLGLTPEISKDKEEMITALIRIYYSTRDNQPQLKKSELSKTAEFTIGKKKSVS